MRLCYASTGVAFECVAEAENKRGTAGTNRVLYWTLVQSERVCSAAIKMTLRARLKLHVVACSQVTRDAGL